MVRWVGCGWLALELQGDRSRLPGVVRRREPTEGGERAMRDSVGGEEVRRDWREGGGFSPRARSEHYGNIMGNSMGNIMATL